MEALASGGHASAASADWLRPTAIATAAIGVITLTAATLRTLATTPSLRREPSIVTGQRGARIGTLPCTAVGWCGDSTATRVTMNFPGPLKPIAGHPIGLWL